MDKIYKYKVGECLIVHNRWKKEYYRMLNEQKILPQWSFVFPFGTVDPFLPRNIGQPAKIIDKKILNWPARFGVKYYKIEFFTSEYKELTEGEKDMVWIEEEELPIIFDKISMFKLARLVRKCQNANLQ